MSTLSFDPAEYKAQQRQTWDTVAPGWRKWWPTFEQGGQSVSDRLVEMAEIGPGQRVLDIATGIGEPALTAARRVGPGGRVVATDFSTGMLAIARQRAADLGLANCDFEVMDAEVPELPSASFDAILSRWALMFFPDLEGTLRALYRLLVPGGRLAAAVWDTPPRVPLIGLREEAISRVLEPPPVPAERPHAFKLADPRLLEQLFTGAGLAGVRIERLAATFSFDSVETFVRYQQDVAGPRIPTLAQQPPERQARFWEAVAAAARPHAGRDGRLELANEVICAAGRRPAAR